jgi:hypothetical protein
LATFFGSHFLIDSSLLWALGFVFFVYYWRFDRGYFV